jgi:hypothetical protein
MLSGSLQFDPRAGFSFAGCVRGLGALVAVRAFEDRLFNLGSMTGSMTGESGGDSLDMSLMDSHEAEA